MLPYSPPALNPKQKEAAEAPAEGGPLLIVAGAGTGKTRTLTSRLLFLISQGVSAGAICAITFTNKAAREMEDRIMGRAEEGKLGINGGSKPYLGTFHALGARILRKECRAFGRTPAFAIFDNHDSLQVVKKVMKRLGIAAAKGGRGRSRAPEGPASFVSRISAAKNGMGAATGGNGFDLRLHGDDNEGKQGDNKFAEVYRAYEQELRNQNAFDFDDLLCKVVALFATHPEILEKYRRKFSHVLVDEYQDLNNVQYELVRLLAGQSGNVSVVGDWRQIIFSWRGSNPEIFTNFESHWEGARVVTLDENYRSSSNIISAASALFANRNERQKQNLWTKNPEGERVKLVEAMDEEDEAERIAETISSFQFPVSKDGASNGNASTAILYRTNAQSRAIEQALLRRAIPYEVYGGLKFYERREIKDIVAALRYAANPKDEVSRERLEKTFSKTRFREFQEELSRAQDQSPPSPTGSSGASPLALIKLFLRITDYFDYMDRNYTNAIERRENIAELMRFASEFSELPPLLEQLSLLQATDAVGTMTNNDNHDRGSHYDKNAHGHRRSDGHRGTATAVQLMTMHLAKGLEFDRVFVAGACEGLLPHARSLDTEDELEEERRLLYVAMTRARRELIISFYDLPSRFLSEIPQELLAFESALSDAEAFSDDEERYITLD